MDIWLKDLKGMWVVSLEEGRVLGTVNDAYLDPASKRLTGVVIRSGILLTGQDQWVPFAAVKKIGDDLIFLAAAGEVRPDDPTGQPISKWLGKSVSTQDGKVLGVLADAAVALESGDLTQLGVGSGQSVAAAPDRTVFGDDLILVQSGAEPGQLVRERRRGGFFSSLLSDEALEQATAQLKRWFRNSNAETPPDEQPPAR